MKDMYYDELLNTVMDNTREVYNFNYDIVEFTNGDISITYDRYNNTLRVEKIKDRDLILSVYNPYLFRKTKKRLQNKIEARKAEHVKEIENLFLEPQKEA